MKRKMIAFLVALCLLLTGIPGAPMKANAAEAEKESVSTDASALAALPAYEPEGDCKILSYVHADVFAQGDHVARLESEESLSSYAFLNRDGTKTVYYLDEVVKFEAADGRILEKDLTLRSEKGGYATTQNDVSLHLPASPASGVRLSYNNKQVTLIPQGGTGTAASDGKAVRYANYYGPGMDLVYTPTMDGVKEEIILSAYSGVNSFTFLLNTGGLNLYQSANRYFLAESKLSDSKIWLGALEIFDAAIQPGPGNVTVETVMPGQQYRITLTVDEDYLTDPNTLYPVTIDPTLTVSDNTHGAGAIEDAPIYEGYPTSNFGSYQYNRAGYAGTTYKKGRTVVRLTGMLNDEGYKAAGADRILSVNFYIADATGGTSSASVKLHPMTENLIWTESNITWYTLGNYSPYAAATATLSGGNYAMFNITELVKKWKQGQYSNGSCGFVMVGASEASVDRSMYSSEHTTASKRPYVVVEYTNEFHSTYLDADLYRNTSYAHDDGLQLRANCYGYAFRFFYDENNFYEGLPAYTTNNIFYHCYKQMPGEFADKSEGLKIYAANGSGQVVRTLWDRKDLDEFYGRLQLFGSVSNETRMNYLVQLMQADADVENREYTLTECTDTILPDAHKYSDRRLIAVVVTPYDFHFYMQHSDNTWSHKPGAGEPSNRCLSDDHSKVLLDNSNIRAHAAEGAYAGGIVKFFYITKNAVVDYGHQNGADLEAGTQPAPELTVISPNQDYAGNHFGAAKNLGVLQQVNKYGKIDYVDDVDFYIFQVQVTKTYSFTASVGTGNDIEFTLYDESGKALLSKDSGTGTVNFTYSLTAGKKYTISISSPDKQTHSQERQYSCSVT